MSEINLSNRSAEELETIAETATSLAETLRQKRPSISAALAAGVVDKSFKSRLHGTVLSYFGEAVVTTIDGIRWRCVGHETCGGPDWSGKHGYVEFIPLNMPQSGIDAYDAAIPAGDTP